MTIERKSDAKKQIAFINNDLNKPQNERSTQMANCSTFVNSKQLQMPEKDGCCWPFVCALDNVIEAGSTSAAMQTTCFPMLVHA